MEALLERPNLGPHHQELWEAFRFLSRSRPVGFAVGYIPLVEMAAYAEAIGYRQVADFMSILRTVDEEYVTEQNQRLDTDGRSETPA